MKIKKIAAITMSRNDEFFLNRWIAYYGQEIGEENLFVYLDGLDQKVPAGASKANVTLCPKKTINVYDLEKYRLKYISDRAAELFKNGYDLIIGCDSDEFLVVDPKIEMNLLEYLSQLKIKTSVSGLGMDFGENLNEEERLDKALPLLQQRSFTLISTRYTKAVVIAKAVRWGWGFHRIKYHNFNIDKNLYLLHFGNADYNMLIRKANDPEIIASGRIRHFKKRIRVVNDTTNKRAIDGDKVFGMARIIQTICRPIYAWNKPAMLGLRLIVIIPERFRKLKI